MTEPAQVIFVAAGPGRSGADSTLTALSAHPFVTTAPVWNVAMTAAVNRLLAHAPNDDHNWLPRRAAQALTDVIARLDAGSAADRAAASDLLSRTRARSVTIPVYGRLWVPDPLPRRHWQRLIRETMLLTASGGSHLAVKIGPHVSRLVAGVLGPEDCLLFAVRHPVETAVQLAASRVDGMRPDEAVQYVDVALRHARHVLTGLDTRVDPVRLEELAHSPESTLARVEEIARLPRVAWPPHVLEALPHDVGRAPDLDHPLARAHGADLTALASQWGYA
ncbi:hypothetical protein [Streptomyces cadmiisoli]|uniref:hypothetical protein n=1 Tax=Streptomyces cadmiisoli TaxID=2184053 RepID=UPI00365DB5EC